MFTVPRASHFAGSTQTTAVAQAYKGQRSESVAEPPAQRRDWYGREEIHVSIILLSSQRLLSSLQSCETSMDPHLTLANLVKTPHTLGPTSALQITGQLLVHGALRVLLAKPPVFLALGFPPEGRTLVSCALWTQAQERQGERLLFRDIMLRYKEEYDALKRLAGLRIPTHHIMALWRH